jgi:transcription initiation factor IIE alpha subunit
MEGSIPREKFAGFDNEAEGYTQLYHDWLDDILQIDNAAELKVVLYIFRHTCGFHEPDVWKHISVDEFMKGRYYADSTRMDQGTSLSENSVRHGLKKAEEDGYILSKTDSRDRARIRKYYMLHFRDAD